MKPSERARAYAFAFPQYPDSHFLVSDRWISATWIMGNNYRSKSGYYGSYPPSYLKRVIPMFPDVSTVLHMFSGSLSAEDVAMPAAKVYRLDQNVMFVPDIVANAEKTGLGGEMFDLIMADPPYSVEDAEHYGRPLCNKRNVLAECRRLLKPGGILLWMDASQPMYRKDEWKWFGQITIYRSTNHRIRGVFFYEKV